MPELPSLILAQKMVLNFRYDDFTLWIIEGPLRIGKSAYVMKAGFQVLEYFYGEPMTWEAMKPYMGWHPAENVEKWLNVKERQPFFIWDDAGMWLFSLDWADPLMVAIQKYMNVVGTDYNNLVLTTPSASWILSKISNMPGMRRIKIIRSTSRKPDAPSKLNARTAICYQPWRSPDLKKHGVYKRFYDKYSCMIPDEIYDIYYPIRREYARLAKEAIREQLRLRSTLSEVQQLKIQKRLRNLQNEESKITKDLAKALDDKGIDL